MPASRQPSPSAEWRLLASGVVLAGLLVLGLSLFQLAAAPPGVAGLLLAAATVAAGRLVIPGPTPVPNIVPSEWLAGATAMAFGPALGTLAVVAARGLGSLRRRHGRPLAIAFDVLEPAVCLWVASQLFVQIAGSDPAAAAARGIAAQVFTPMLAAVVYFVLRTALTSAAIAFERRSSLASVWRAEAVPHALSSYVLLWLAACAGHFNLLGLLGVLLVSAPYAGLFYLGHRQLLRVKAHADIQTRALEALYQGAIEALAVAVDAKDQVTHGHIRRVQRHTTALARGLGMHDPNELKALDAASLLHDIGKLAVPDYVLNKPGALTRTEFRTMMSHASRGALILEAIGFPYPVVPMVRHHHEQWNGRGYPDGLAGERIPLGARILSVVDCFDALTSDRPYRRKLSDEQAIDILRERSGVFYDPHVVNTFIGLIPGLRCEDFAVEAGRVPTSVEEAFNDPPESVEGTLALKVDLTTPDAVGRLLRIRTTHYLPQAEFCLFVPDAGGTRLWPIHASAALRPLSMAVEIRSGEGLAGWVATNRHTIINSHPDLDFPEAGGGLGLARAVSTPVFAFGTIAGVLSVYTRQAEGFSDREVRIIGAIAQELGVEFSRHDRTLAYELTPIEDTPPLANAG